MPIDTSVYERQRRAVQDQYSANSTTNEYSRFLSQQRGQRQIGDNARNFGRSYPKFASGWGNRGLQTAGTRSGLYQQAMQQYVGDYGRNTDQIMQGYADEQRGFDLSAQRMQTEQQRALADIEAAKQNEIAMTALNIQQLKPLIGG